MALFDVIKFDGFSDRKWVVYKHPCTEINTKSKLIVGPGQVAVAVHAGKVENIFESGIFTVTTENFPFIERLVKSVYGGKVPFPMEVYFINKTIKLDMLWGTRDPLQVIDPNLNVKVRARARGQFGVRIANYQFLITTLLGAIQTKNLLEFDTLGDFFRGLINTKVKTVLGEYIIHKDVGLLDMSVYLEEISNVCKERLAPEFERFGIELINFYFESINVPDEDLERINGILNKKAEFDIMGDYRYRTARGFDVLESAAENEGTGGAIAGAGIGLGLGVGAGQAVGNLMSRENPIIPPATKTCGNCGSAVGAVNFCPQCGERVKQNCPSCNKVLPGNVNFCPECGAKIKRGE